MDHELFSLNWKENVIGWPTQRNLNFDLFEKVGRLSCLKPFCLVGYIEY